jgi:outer membrane protein assembly factor BamE (lipoprotein component of BamABCDE complex)
VAGAPVAVPASSQALVSPTMAATAPSSAAKSSQKPDTSRTEIKPGMTADDVRRLLGAPEAEVAFGDKTRWSYPGMTVVFVKGKVTDVRF